MTDSQSLPHFLIVEDDEIDMETVRRAFHSLDREVILNFAHDGLEALEFLKDPDTIHPMMILLDLNMPRMNGFELLDEIRNDPRLHMHQIFVLTTSGDDRDLLAAYERHVAGYIVKPVSHDKICSAMRILGDLWDINLYPPIPVAKTRTEDQPAAQPAE